MIPYLQLLCIAGFLYPIHLVNVQVLQAQGKSNLNFRITVIKNSLRLVNIALMYRFGVVFIILGEIVTSFLALGINTYYTRRLIDYGMIAQFKDIKQITILAILAGTAGYAVVHSIPNLYFSFGVGFLVSLGGYIFLQYIFNKVFFMGLLKLKENFVK